MHFVDTYSVHWLDDNRLTYGNHDKSSLHYERFCVKCFWFQIRLLLKNQLIVIQCSDLRDQCTSANSSSSHQSHHCNRGWPKQHIHAETLDWLHSHLQISNHETVSILEETRKSYRVTNPASTQGVGAPSNHTCRSAAAPLSRYMIGPSRSRSGRFLRMAGHTWFRMRLVSFTVILVGTVWQSKAPGCRRRQSALPWLVWALGLPWVAVGIHYQATAPTTA